MRHEAEQTAKACCDERNYDGPCREKASTVLREKARRMHARAVELDALADRFEHSPPGDPAEAAMWNMACEIRV